MLINAIIVNVSTIILSLFLIQYMNTVPFEISLFKNIKNKKFFFRRHGVYLIITSLIIMNILGWALNYNIESKEYILLSLVFMGLISLSFIDIRHFAVPQSMNMGTLFIAMYYLSLKNSFFIAFVDVATVIGALIIIVYSLEAIRDKFLMGEGDLIAMGSMFAILQDYKLLMVAVFVSSVVVAITLLSYALKCLIENKKEDIQKFKVPFIPYLTVGTLITIFYGNIILEYWVKFQ